MEIQKMDLEDKCMSESIDKYKNTIIEEIKGFDKNNITFYMNPSVKYKKPLKVRIREFCDKLRKVLGL